VTAPQPPLQDLLDPNDPDWAKFQAQDPDWFLAVAGDAIRDYCGWHIYPNLQLNVSNLEIGTRGLINLPAMLVTDVISVTIQASNAEQNMLLDPAEYNWYDYGVIEPLSWHWWSAYGGFYYGPDNWSFLPIYQYGLATVVFNAGYTECPRVIKEIAYELTTVTSEVAAGNVKEIQTPGFRLSLMQAYGATLNADQKNKLSKYRLPTVR
jgi:hypothetical protein